ncbi:OmpA family protein [Desulfurivibrio sp. D14AmB]|uniref:OmpA family protein n=1 Tax=Desulfurivibrio sp. D14AmB TaxID=3374370 RepID=UPI00376F294F
MYNPLRTQPEERTVRRRPAPAAAEVAGAAAGLPRYLREATPDAGVADAGGGPTDAAVPLPAGVPAAEAVPATPPTGPDACATPAEEERKERFRNRKFSVINYRPSAGYGKFDAFYWPRLSRMAAVVRMKFNYVQAVDTPSPLTLLGMWRAGQNIRRFFWSDAEKRQFARDYVQRVAHRWSFAHAFRSSKPCWPFVAWPYVTPLAVGLESLAHFSITVQKSSGPGIDYASGVAARNPGTAGWRGSGTFRSSDVREAASFNSVHVARSERRRLERAVTAATASPVLFAKNSDLLQPPYLARVRTLAAAMMAKNPSDPAVPMVCAGFASAEGRAEHNQRLSQRRAEAVGDELRRAGVPQPVVVSARGAVGDPNDAANRKVEIAPSTTFETSYAANRYSVAEHEFGHALGLPDEYVNRTSGVLGDKQTAFANLAQAAGVAPPDRWGERTSSLMSAGVDVLPRHYLTIWEALGHMTTPDITRDQWRIG